MILGFISCEDEPYLDDRQEAQTEINPYAGGVQFENPYDFQNMNKALTILREKINNGTYKLVDYNASTSGQGQNRGDFDINNFEITISHKYVKFTPQTEADVAILKRDSTIVYSDYPLDYDFPDSYFDNRPVYSEDYIPEYFAVLPINKSIPNVSHTVLGELYLPEQDPYFAAEGEFVTKETIIGNEEDLLHHLMYEAYTLVGKEQYLLEDGGSFEGNGDGNRFWVFGRKWYPNGNVSMFDQHAGVTPDREVCRTIRWFDFDDCPFTVGGDDPIPSDCGSWVYETICHTIPGFDGIMIPMEGTQVLMRQLLTVRQVTTDANGDFSTNFVRGKARYIIQWERYHYSIRDGLTNQAELRGPNVKERSHNFVIMGGEDLYHATIQEAAHEYYYGNTLGTHRPQMNGTLQSQMKIAAMETNGKSSHIPEFNYLFFPIQPKIKVKAWDHNTEERYGTTIHELAHSAHRELDLGSYNSLITRAWALPCVTLAGCNDPSNIDHQTARRLLETWATTVEIEMTLNRYRNQFGQDNYQYINSNFQLETIAGEEYYTSAGRDMIDDVPQGDQFNGRPIDNVSGYTLGQLESALNGSNTFLQWRLNLANQTNNATEGNLPELFNNWE